MKRLFALITVFLLFSIGFVSITLTSPSQTVTIPYAKFNSGTPTEYNIAEINATWTLVLWDNVTWASNSEGNITIYDLDLVTNYIIIHINGSEVAVYDENEDTLFSSTEYTEYIYLNSYLTYFKMKTDDETTWVVKSHDNFGIQTFEAVGATDNATAGNCKATFGTGIGAIDISLIEQIIPIMVTMAVISMVVKMLSKMTEKMGKV